MSDALEIRRVRQTDILGGFRCGDYRLDNFIKNHALLNDARSLSSTWLAFADGGLAGYLNVVSTVVARSLIDPLIAELPPYPDVPALLLARMATASKHQRKGVGVALVRRAYEIAVEQATLSGCAGVHTHAKAATRKNPSAAPFYERCGFLTVVPPTTDDAPTGMFVSLDVVRARLSQASITTRSAIE